MTQGIKNNYKDVQLGVNVVFFGLTKLIYIHGVRPAICNLHWGLMLTEPSSRLPSGNTYWQSTTNQMQMHSDVQREVRPTLPLLIMSSLMVQIFVL